MLFIRIGRSVILDITILNNSKSTSLSIVNLTKGTLILFLRLNCLKILEFFFMYGETCSRSEGKIAFFHVFSNVLNEKISASIPKGYVRARLVDA